MITLYTFGPAFGLPDASPFVIKAQMLLKLAGLPFVEKRGGLRGAPKGKLPFIDDDGARVADSTFIRLHIEKRHGFDFDAGLSNEQRGQAWALEKMLEDHLYWLAVSDRWMNDANFNKGPVRFFDVAPAVLRPLIIPLVRRNVRRNLAGQGLGRHTEPERAELARRAVAALADMLGDKPFLMGDAPCGADATALAFVASGLCPLFESATRTAMEDRPNLVAYRDRMMARYNPVSA
jgi:glutathione S-transferase